MDVTLLLSFSEILCDWLIIVLSNVLKFSRFARQLGPYRITDKNL